jgi:hypothetical protein
VSAIWFGGAEKLVGIQVVHDLVRTLSGESANFAEELVKL